MNREWERVTDPMNPPSKGYLERSGSIATSKTEHTMINIDLKDASAHATACHAALFSAYGKAVETGNGMAAYAIELTLRDAVKLEQCVNNLVAASEPERSGQ